MLAVEGVEALDRQFVDPTLGFAHADFGAGDEDGEVGAEVWDGDMVGVGRGEGDCVGKGA